MQNKISARVPDTALNDTAALTARGLEPSDKEFCRVVRSDLNTRRLSRKITGSNPASKARARGEAQVVP